MAGMKRSCVLCPIVAVLALPGCGSGANQATTIAGVGVKTTGPPPRPSTPTACTNRWNAPANAGGRAAANHQAPKADAALVRTAGTSGYFREEAGRCLIYLVTPSKSALVFVEAAPGRFVFTADASGQFATNADLQQSERLHLH
jgi:hypothetical protein